MFLTDFGEGGGREVERNINVRNIIQLPPVPASKRDRTQNLDLCPDQATL